MAVNAGTAVVGGGPAGLATAAVLVRAGLPVTLLERGDQVGASWISRYDSLRLHTVGGCRAFPGCGFLGATVAGSVAMI